MNQANTQKLFTRFKFFHPERPPTHGLMCFGFECGNGWFGLIWNLCEAIEPLVDGSFGVVQVKEKFGGLRFYTTAVPQEVCDLIDKAEALSLDTCEVCGEPGEVRDDGWVRTRCDSCHGKRLRREAERKS